MAAPRTVLLALLLSLLLLPLGSGEVVRLPLVCPLCGAPFDGAQAVPPARSAGSDSDFCDYSAGGSTRAFDVQVCTSCGYTDKLAFFLSGESLPPAAKRDLPPRLKDIWNGKPPASQQAAPIARKFEAALVCAAAIGWFVDAMGLLPLLPLALAILFNNAVVGVVLLPPRATDHHR